MTCGKEALLLYVGLLSFTQSTDGIPRRMQGKDRKWMGVLTSGTATHLASEDSRHGPVNPTVLFPNSLGYSFLLPVEGAQRLERVVCSQGD